VNDVPAKDRDIAMVFQSYALYPHMTIANNLAFGLRRRGFPRLEIERRVNDAAAMLGLTDLLGRKPYSLSGGQRQRVALGRAIVRDPKVFLFDEPLSNLDAALRVSMRNEIVRQHRRLGTTMIYVTHDQVEAMTMSTRMCIMNQGRLVQSGRPLDVYRNPADTFVARFLGSPPMNLIPAILEANEGGIAARIGVRAVELTGWRPGDVSTHIGQRVVFGIRPEHLHEPNAFPATGKSANLNCEVQTVEPLGADTILLLTLDGVEIAARVDGESTARIGDRIDIAIETANVHLFDTATTKAITRKVH
jgi:multiple sugar transport system ATP-binding protein